MKTAIQLVWRLRSLTLLFPLVAAMAGCGIGTVNQSSGGSLALTGNVHGGLQPVTGATIELFAAGTAGNGSQARNILTQPVATDANGSFSITGDYTCTSSTEQVYLVARGGNPGFQGNVNNTALVMLDALGSCVDLISNANAYIYVNEVSTAAAVYALPPFMTAYDHVGSSANAQLLASTSDGQAAALGSGLKIEQAKLYSLANVIASCVNTTGAGACSPLFSAATPSGVTAPTDTVGALLNIVRHPGNNIAAVFDLTPPIPPYPGGLTRAPSDWTMSLTVSGGGLYDPTGLGVDQYGNVWVANFGGPSATGSGSSPTGLVAFTPQGAPFPGTPFASNLQTEVYGLALDRNGDVWMTSEENIAHNGTYGSIAKVQGASSGTPGAVLGQFYDNTLDFPESIAADPNGTILVGNYASSTATTYDLKGNYLSNVGAGSMVFPDDLTSDGAGGVWVANQGDYSITHVPASGTPQKVTCCSEANTVALDPQGNVWVTNFGLVNSEYTFSVVSSAGAVLIRDQALPGLSTPGGAAVDAGGQFWVLNYHEDSFMGIAGESSGAVGTGLSPIALGKDAGLIEPFSIAPDPSGNLWVSNSAQNSLVMFFGLATPTATPATPRPSVP